MLAIILFPILIATVLAQNQIERQQGSAIWDQQFLGTARSTNARQFIAQRASPTDNDEPCAGPGTECVPYHKCKNQITDSSGLVDVVVKDIPECPGILDVCCAANSQTTDPIVEMPKLTTQGCGYRNTNGIGFRLSGGKDNETQFGEFPWMTAVLEKKPTADGTINYYLCGGSLIHPSVVLTAAHCVTGKANNVLKVRLGEWDTQTTDEPLPYQDRDINEVRIHEGFKKGALQNDIALLFLATPADIAENVKTICLPSATETFDYKRCFATGWGKDRFGAAGKYQVVLKKIDLPIIPQDECQQRLRSTRLSQYFELHDSFICAGGEEGKDTCKGDGGSPLVCPVTGSSNRYNQAGIVAWGIGCGGTNIPGVYAKVPMFREWIDQVLREKAIDQSSYSV